MFLMFDYHSSVSVSGWRLSFDNKGGDSRRQLAHYIFIRTPLFHVHAENADSITFRCCF